MELPANALVMLVGAAASGKSTWARRHFGATEVVSSDRCRALVSDSEEEQRANPQAFGVFYAILRGRASLGRLSVADSTALQPWARERIRRIGVEHAVPVHVVVFRVPAEELLRRNAARVRRVPAPVLLQHAARVEALLASGALADEGYAGIRLADAGEAPVRGPAVLPPDREAPAERAGAPGGL